MCGWCEGETFRFRLAAYHQWSHQQSQASEDLPSAGGTEFLVSPSLGLTQNCESQPGNFEFNFCKFMVESQFVSSLPQLEVAGAAGQRGEFGWIPEDGVLGIVNRESMWFHGIYFFMGLSYDISTGFNFLTLKRCDVTRIVFFRFNGNIYYIYKMIYISHLYLGAAIVVALMGIVMAIKLCRSWDMGFL